MNRHERVPKSRAGDGGEPGPSALLSFTLHELAATCLIGAVVFAVVAWTEADLVYWILAALCVVAVPVSLRLARR